MRVRRNALYVKGVFRRLILRAICPIRDGHCNDLNDGSFLVDLLTFIVSVLRYKYLYGGDAHRYQIYLLYGDIHAFRRGGYGNGRCHCSWLSSIRVVRVLHPLFLYSLEFYSHSSL